MKHPSHSPSVRSPIDPLGHRRKICECIFGKSLPRVRVTGILVSAVLALLVVGPAFAAEVVVHVAPTGDDAADGSRAKPVASLIGARDAVRRLRAEGKAGPVRVVVADGTYRVAEPLVLRPEDGGSAEAPVRYEAAPGAKPVLSGGRKITGFRAGENGCGWPTCRAWLRASGISSSCGSTAVARGVPWNPTPANSSSRTWSRPT
jgi:hypothetical protein